MLTSKFETPETAGWRKYRGLAHLSIDEPSVAWLVPRDAGGQRMRASLLGESCGVHRCRPTLADDGRKDSQPGSIESWLRLPRRAKFTGEGIGLHAGYQVGSFSGYSECRELLSTSSQGAARSEKTRIRRTGSGQGGEGETAYLASARGGSLDAASADFGNRIHLMEASLDETVQTTALRERGWWCGHPHLYRDLNPRALRQLGVSRRLARSSRAGGESGPCRPHHDRMRLKTFAALQLRPATTRCDTSRTIGDVTGFPPAVLS